MAKQMYKCQANAHGEATVMVKLDAHVKRRMNALLTRDESTLVVKLNARGEAAYKHSRVEAKLEQV